MTAQVLFFNDFSRKDQHLNAVKYIKVINIVGIHTYMYIYIYIYVHIHIYMDIIYMDILYIPRYMYTHIYIRI